MDVIEMNGGGVKVGPEGHDCDIDLLRDSGPFFTPGLETAKPLDMNVVGNKE